MSRRLEALPSNVIELLQKCEDPDVIRALTFEIFDIEGNDEIISTILQRLE